MLTATLFGQSASVGGAPYRDKPKEEEVADMFRAMRSQVGGKPLGRVKHRRELQQLTCSATVLDRTMHSLSTVIYKSTTVADISADIRRLAAQDKDGRGGTRRFSVAVWRKRSAVNTAPEQYWVGIGLYHSAGSEWFENHLTDEGFYSKQWKGMVVPECRKK